MTYVIDTHSLVWFLEGNPRLSVTARNALRDDAAEFVIPTIVLAELAFLHSRRRVPVALSDVFAYVDGARNSLIYPLDESVVEQISTELEIHDAIIVATALVLRDALGRSVAIVTKDEMIAASGLVEVIW